MCCSHPQWWVPDRSVLYRYLWYLYSQGWWDMSGGLISHCMQNSRWSSVLQRQMDWSWNYSRIAYGEYYVYDWLLCCELWVEHDVMWLLWCERMKEQGHVEFCDWMRRWEKLEDCYCDSWRDKASDDLISSFLPRKKEWMTEMFHWSVCTISLNLYLCLYLPELHLRSAYALYSYWYPHPRVRW